MIAAKNGVSLSLLVRARAVRVAAVKKSERGTT
jgi:hypothetical protein